MVANVRTIWLTAVAVLVGGLFVAGAARANGWDPATADGDRAKLVARCEEAISDFKAVDPSMDRFFREAYGYAVLPRVTKGAVGVAVFVRDKGGAMAEASLGGQRYKIRELK